MTAPHDAEREVDLARWRRAVVALWWLPVAGLVIGAIVGVLFSFRGGTNYKATALISLGQPTSPGGALVNGFGTNPRAVSQIVTGADTQAQAAGTADMRPAALRGHVSVAQVGSASGAGSARSTPLISLSVTGSHPLNTAAAANALAEIVIKKTTAPYVGVKIRTFQQTLGQVSTEIASANQRLAIIQKALNAAAKLDPFEQLVIVGQQDNAETRLGNLIAQQETLQQQLAFAKTVESAEIIEKARSLKASAHSRGASLVIGALIGLILGAIVAIAGEGRFSGRRAAAV